MTDVCKRNHPLSGPNAKVRFNFRPDGYVARICKVCENIRQRERYKKIKFEYNKMRGMDT